MRRGTVDGAPDGEASLDADGPALGGGSAPMTGMAIASAATTPTSRTDRRCGVMARVSSVDLADAMSAAIGTRDRGAGTHHKPCYTNDVGVRGRVDQCRARDGQQDQPDDGDQDQDPIARLRSRRTAGRVRVRRCALRSRRFVTYATLPPGSGAWISTSPSPRASSSDRSSAGVPVRIGNVP